MGSRYELIGELARGGMGVVHLAFAHAPANSGRLVVVKELKAEYSGEASFRDMFLEEGRLAARLNHPNIVQTYDLGNDGPGHFLVMEYLEGVTLGRVLRRKSPRFSRGMHLRVLCDMLEGLEYAHTLRDFEGDALGIVHRDVNPANVFITFEGHVKLVDFGIAKTLASKVDTGNGILKGKAAYMAPEQIAGAVDRRADVYSVGVMLWEALANQRMWTGKTDVEVLVHVVREQLPHLRQIAPDVPEPLALIVDRALAKNPEERFPSARGLQEALEEFLDGERDATTRAVKRALNELFAEERAERQRAVQAELAEIRASTWRASPHPAAREPQTQPESQQQPASLAPVHIGHSSAPMPLSIPPLPALDAWAPTPTTLGPAPRRSFPHSAIVQAAAVVALVGLSFFVGFRSKRLALPPPPASAAASLLEEAKPLVPLEPIATTIGPAPTLEPPPAPSPSGLGMWALRTPAPVARPKPVPAAIVPVPSAAPAAEDAPPPPAPAPTPTSAPPRPSGKSIRIIGSKKTNVLVLP